MKGPSLDEALSGKGSGLVVEVDAPEHDDALRDAMHRFFNAIDKKDVDAAVDAWKLLCACDDDEDSTKDEE